MKLRFPHRIEVKISSRDFLVKVVEFLQQNWQLILPFGATILTATLRTRHYSPFCAHHPHRSMRPNSQAPPYTPRDGSDGIERLAPTYFVGEFLPSRPPATTITNDSTEGQMGFYYRTFARRRPCRLNEPRSGAWESACGPALRMGGKGGHG